MTQICLHEWGNPHPVTGVIRCLHCGVKYQAPGVSVEKQAAQVKGVGQVGASVFKSVAVPVPSLIGKGKT